MNRDIEANQSNSNHRNYWRESSRPLTSLLFVLPFLAIYEFGMAMLNRRGLRNGVDVWLRDGLDQAGFSQYFLLPLLTCGLLLAWHHMRAEAWQANRKVLGGMAIESVVLGMALLVWAHSLGRLLRGAEVSWPFAVCATGPAHTSWHQALSVLGAGIYEELLFRLMLVPVLAGVFASLIKCSRTRLISAVILSSLLFAAAHYRWELQIGNWYWAFNFGEEFAWRSFLFRASAGMFFGALFIARGFGIAVGAHALYDVLVVLS
jgi:membrane protease YdiL (CAAX protease family)